MLPMLLLAAALPAPSPTPSPTPQRLLGLIRAVFRSHRPPPPYEVYTMERKQLNDRGFPDFAGSYTYKYWVRTSDDAALKRHVYRGDFRGTLEFDRPAFNEARDPGPPTADVFAPAPVTPRPVTFVPTPEPEGTPLRTIATIVVAAEFDYHVVSVEPEDDLLHLVLTPLRDPERNRLRQLWVDAKTLELERFIATDRLFVENDKTYPVIFDCKLDRLAAIPVVTACYGTVHGGYQGDGENVDFAFTDTSFPTFLPAWYFDPRDYAQHQTDAPI
ncbi:MAG: hypothetical protein ACREM2_09275 [Vulcanimicrobiaceae bacterium]